MAECGGWFAEVRPCSGSAYSERFQEGEQLVVRTIPPRMRFRVGDLSERFFLQPHVGVDIDLSGLHGFMPEPEGDYRLVDAMVQQFHRSAVAQRVWRDSLAGEARASS